ncbi:MAG: hypothetical protein ACM3KR_08230 [Deltaproteobacteria bacterium]
MTFSTIDIVNYSLIGIIVLLLTIIIVFVLRYLFKKDSPPSAVVGIKERNSNLNLSNSAKKKKKGKEAQPEEEVDPKIFSGEALLDFDKIYKGMVMKNDGSLFSMVLQCRGINFDLMSEEERIVFNKRLLGFFNNLTFPMQIHTQTRVLKLNTSFNNFSQRRLNLANELKTIVAKFNDTHLNQPDNKTLKNELAKKILKKQKLYNYLKNFEQELTYLTTNNFIIQSNYYVILSCSSEQEPKKPGKPVSSEAVDIAYNELASRSKQVSEAFTSCGIETTILNSFQLSQLLYSTFNQGEENFSKINELREAGFFN